MEKETTTLFKGFIKAKDIGKPVLPCSFGSTSYYGLCDIGSSINVIPYTLYAKIKDEIYSSELHTINMNIKLADRTFRTPYGILQDVYIILGTFTYPIDLVVMEIPEDDFCPIIFGRPFMNTVGAQIDYKKEIVSLCYGEEKREFHFSRFKNHLQHDEDKSTEDKTITQLAAIYFGTPKDELIRSLTDYEQGPEDLEKEEIDQRLNEAPPLESPMNETYEVPEKKGDEGLPHLELKPLPEELRYEFLDQTKRYPMIISANLSEKEKDKLMKTLRNHRKAFGYSMDDLKGINPSICTHRIYMEEGATPIKEF